MSALAALRTAIAADHESVDTAFGHFDLATTDGYKAFLTAHARALPAVEAALADRADIPALRPRTPLLAADLSGMDLAVPQLLDIDPPANTAESFGMAYVIEGSRLGGGLLAKRVPPSLPHAYLSATHLPGEWRGFGKALDVAATDQAWIERAITAAKRVFALYAKAARA